MIWRKFYSFYISPTVCLQNLHLRYLPISIMDNRTCWMSDSLTQTKIHRIPLPYRSVMLLCRSILLSFGAPFSPFFLVVLRLILVKGWNVLYLSDVCLQFTKIVQIRVGFCEKKIIWLWVHCEEISEFSYHCDFTRNQFLTDA